MVARHCLQNGNRLKLTLRTDERFDWSRDGKPGIDLLFDDNSCDEMQNALKQAATLTEKRKMVNRPHTGW